MKRYFIKENGFEEAEVSYEQWNTKKTMLGITSMSNSFETSSTRGRVEDCEIVCINGPIQYFNAILDEKEAKKEDRWNLLWQLIIGFIITSLVALWVVITNLAPNHVGR